MAPSPFTSKRNPRSPATANALQHASPAFSRPSGFVLGGGRRPGQPSSQKRTSGVAGVSAGHPLDKGREARQVSRMAFGPFAVKTSFGETTIANPTTATAFLRALGPSYRTTYHWKVAERMLEVAWTSAEAEDMAAQAFKIALEAADLLID